MLRSRLGCSCGRREARMGHSQAGMATMTISLLMLLVVSILIFYTNKGIWLEQRSATNQYRAKQAQGAAEAGLEYVLSVLNSTSGTPNRSTHLTIASTPGKYTIASSTITGSPAASMAYSVVISPVAGDSSPYDRFVLNATGGSDCATTGTLSTCSGRAVTSQVVKLTPVLLSPPDDGASIFGNFSMVGSGSIINTTGIGYPLRTRDTTPTATGSSAITGTLTDGNCATSRAVCGAFSTITTTAQFFSSFFGSSTTDIASMTTPITSGASLGTSTTGLVWHTGTLSLNSSVGSAANPVLLVVDGDLSINGNRVIYGFVYVTGTLTMNGNVSIQGAVATGGNFDLNGGGGTQNVNMDRDVVARLKTAASNFNKVLGTWKDW